MDNMSKSWDRRRKRIFQIIEVGNDLDTASRAYDFLNVILIVVNLTVSIMYTYDNLRENYGDILLIV